MSKSAIEWTDATWNPVTGCDRVSPGCAHCYALELAPKLRRFAAARGKGKWLDVRDGGPASGPAFGVTLHPQVLEEPLRWRKPRRVFVNSMSDLFHEAIPWRFVARIFAVMARAEQHTFQVPTKRPERAQVMLTSGEFWQKVEANYGAPLGACMTGALPNVWLGVTIENRRYVHRADVLRETPAAVRFVSAEPLLGPLVPFTGWRSPRDRAHRRPPESWWPDGHEGRGLSLKGIDWLIVGGESGAQHRRIDPEWVRDLRDACGPDTAFFFKQWGGARPKSGGRELDGRTWDELPQGREVAAA